MSSGCVYVYPFLSRSYSEVTLAGRYEPYGLGRRGIKQYIGIVWSAQRTHVINDLGLDRVRFISRGSFRPTPGHFLYRNGARELWATGCRPERTEILRPPRPSSLSFARVGIPNGFEQNCGPAMSKTTVIQTYIAPSDCGGRRKLVDMQKKRPSHFSSHHPFLTDVPTPGKMLMHASHDRRSCLWVFSLYPIRVEAVIRYQGQQGYRQSPQRMCVTRPLSFGNPPLSSF